MYDDANANSAKSVNFAPILPLQKLKEQASKAYSSSSFAQIAKEWHDEIWGRHQDEREQIAESGFRMANVRSGKLLVKRDPIYGGIALVKPLPVKARNDVSIYPLAQTNSSQLTSLWTLSRPHILPRHFGTTTAAQIQHAVLEQVIGHYDRANLDEEVHQRWSLSMMDYGTSNFRIYYDRNLNTLISSKPIIEDINETLFEGYQACLDCPKEGTPSEFDIKGEVMPRCPDCGGYNVSEGLDEIVVPATKVIGSEEIVQGDIGIEMLDVPASVWDMARLTQDSAYFGYMSSVPTQLTRALMGIDVQESPPEADPGMAVIQALNTRGGSVEGWGRERSRGNIGRFPQKTAYMYEDYYEPSWYMGCKLEKPEKVVGGIEIPAGVPFEQIWPEGLCVVSFDQGRMQVGVFGEKRRVIGSVYHIQSSSGVGKGTTDAVEIYEQLNDAHSANLAVIKHYGAGGGYAYDKEVLTRNEAKELTKPGGLVGVQMRNTRYNSINDVVTQMHQKEVNNSNLTMVAQLANLMNIAFQTTEFTSGVINDNIDINTARGQEMLAAQNQQRSAAPLRMKGFSTAKIMEEVVELFRECIKHPIYIYHADKFGLSKGRLVSGSDLPEKVRCDFVTDSEIPLNRYTKSLNAQNMLEKSQFFGIPFMDLAQSKPRVAAWWADMFQADIPIFNQQEILMVCQSRVDKLKELCEAAGTESQLMGTPPDPAAIVDQLRVLEFEENHIIKAQVLGEYLDDDEVREWPDLMVQAVQELIARHHEFDNQVQGAVLTLAAKNQGVAEGTMQGTAMMTQAEITAPLMQQQQEAAAAEAQQAMVQEGVGRAADLAAEEEALGRDEEAAEYEAGRNERAAQAQFARDRAAAAVDHERNMELKKYERANSNSGGSSRPKRKR